MGLGAWGVGSIEGIEYPREDCYTHCPYIQISALDLAFDPCSDLVSPES